MQKKELEFQEHAFIACCSVYCENAGVDSKFPVDLLKMERTKISSGKEIEEEKGRERETNIKTKKENKSSVKAKTK